MLKFSRLLLSLIWLNSVTLLRFTWFFKAFSFTFSIFYNIPLTWLSILPYCSATGIVSVSWDSIILVTTWSNFTGVVHRIVFTTLLLEISSPYTLILTRFITRDILFYHFWIRHFISFIFSTQRLEFGLSSLLYSFTWRLQYVTHFFNSLGIFCFSKYWVINSLMNLWKCQLISSTTEFINSLF